MKYKLLGKLKDDIYPTSLINEVRFCSRGLVFNDNDEIAIIHVVGQDDFGTKDYYELPGGGGRN